MSKITNDGLARSGTGCCIHMATVGIKGVIIFILILCSGCVSNASNMPHTPELVEK